VADEEALRILKKGPEAWNKWRWEDFRRAALTRADLTRASLTRADLTKADLSETDLSGAQLSGADLSRADLSRANLSRANLMDADLIGADLREADLSGADLNGADLREANLRGARLSGVDLRRARIWETSFVNTNLREVMGLDSCYHEGPSTLDHRTLSKSGRLPLAFLRGCGLPDKLIDYLPPLLNEPIQFYSCFISYSTKDQEFAERLYADLQNKGVRCWFAPHDIASGKKIHEQIDEAIRLHERLMLILSPASIESEWVKTEIAKARKREVRERRRVLFPVRLVTIASLQDWEFIDPDTGTDLAREIREYFIPDFSRWKDHDSYRAAFEKLLRDLEPSVQSPTSP
jgi:hypothetical protein